MNTYNKLSSEVYDLDKPIGHSFGDVEFYIERLASCKGKILEAGVGTGRILIPLLEAGYDVEGFDLSQEMLAFCKSHCKERGLHTKIMEADMTTFSFPDKYEAIIVPTGTFLLIHDREKSISALKRFHHHLLPGGRLIIDIFLQDNFPIGKVSSRTWNSENGDIITLQSSMVKVDFLNQYTLSHHRYEKWRNGTLLQSELEQFPLRWYGVEEFKLLLTELGFETINISSNYSHGEYPKEANQTITFEAMAKK